MIIDGPNNVTAVAGAINTFTILVRDGALNPVYYPASPLAWAPRVEPEDCCSVRDLFNGTWLFSFQDMVARSDALDSY